MKSLWLILLVLLPCALYSQVQKAVRLENPPRFDGVVEKDEWEGTGPLPIIQFLPLNGEEVRDKSEVFMAYDDDYLYLAGVLHNKNPEDMMAQSFKRDIFTYAIDYFGFNIDQFNDNENGLVFATTPRATRTDWLTFNDAQGGFPFNSNWNTFWDARTTFLEDGGWQAEIRIPWTSLRFNVEDGKTVMGVGYWRHISKTGEDQATPGMSNTFGGWSLFRPSGVPRYEFEGLVSKRPLYVAPYVLGGVTQTSQLNGLGTDYELDNDATYNAGLDIKFSPSSNLTMDLTFNTDFAQVEADDQQVNLTRFSLFFPEKRLFFQERSSTFRTTPNTGFNRVFYSRKIGLEDGNTVPIIAGARLVGRVGKWDIGFLDMQTASTEEVEGANHGVVRLRRQTINNTSNIGMILTNKTDFKDDTFTSFGVDGNINVIRKDFFRFGWYTTKNQDVESDSFIDISKIYLQWQNTGSKGLGYDIAFSRIGDLYDPVMGFELRNNVTNYNPQVWHAWIFGDGTRFQSAQLRAQSSVFTRNSDGGVLESANHSLSFSYVTKIQAEGSISLNRLYDDVLNPFALGDDAEIPAGSYSFNNIDFRITSPQGKELVFNGFGNIGNYYDGDILSLGTEVNWKPTPVINATVNYQFNRILAEQRGMDFQANIARIKTELTFDTRWSAAMFYQLSDAAHFSLINFRLRFNPREGNDFFLVFNEGMNLDRTRELPILPVVDTRTILLKYTHTFVW